MYNKNSHKDFPPVLKGYDNLIIDNREFPYFRDIVLLNELKNLFDEKITFIFAQFFNTNRKINKNILLEICPDHYKNIFIENKNVENNELLKSEFPKYYDYINNFSIKSTIIFDKDNFKKLYNEIIDLININIQLLVDTRKQATDSTNIISTTSLGMLITNLKGHNGDVIYKLEYPNFKKIVLLYDLIKLFNKALPDISEFTLHNHKIDKELLANKCSDHYNKIFEKENSILNVEELKTEFPKYYNFISSFEPNDITVENFKELLTEIVDLTNTNIKYLVESREKVKTFFKEGIPMRIDSALSERTDPINNNYKDDISKELQIKENNPIPVREIKEKKLPKIIKPKYAVDKLIWNKSIYSLETIFTDLIEKSYIKPFDLNVLANHFIINFKEEMLDDSTEIFKEINWVKEYPEFAFLIYTLKKEKFLSFKNKFYQKALLLHFLIKGEKINKDTLNTFLSEIKNRYYQEKDSEYISKFLELKNLIIRIRNL